MNLLSILKMDFVKINQIGKNLRSLSCLLCCLILVFGSSFQSLAAISSSSNAFAVNPDYLIGSASNADPYAIATMELTDEDYSIQPFSSIGSVTNSINSNTIDVAFHCYNPSTEQYFWVTETAYLNNGKYDISYTTPQDYRVIEMAVMLGGHFPVPGTYELSFDYSSDFSYDWLAGNIYVRKDYKNAESVAQQYDITFDQFSGDIYLPPEKYNIGNINHCTLSFWIAPSLNIRNVGGSFAVNFKRVDASSSAPELGGSVSESDYQDDVSGSLSNISSSIGDMSSSMDSAAESLEYISTSQNLIIQGIDNVIMHISDQLYAFWDQLYNLIHEPTYARLGDILDAIRNLDLEITVEMTEVSNAINKMNQDMQNKLQNVQQTITQGFDNSVIESEASKLDDSISEYDEAEQSVIQNVNDSLNDFEFDAELGEYQSIVSVVSDFLQQLYESSGGFKVLINLSMLLSLAGIVIGIYRFGGGS